MLFILIGWLGHFAGPRAWEDFPPKRKEFLISIYWLFLFNLHTQEFLLWCFDVLIWTVQNFYMQQLHRVSFNHNIFWLPRTHKLKILRNKLNTSSSTSFSSNDAGLNKLWNCNVSNLRRAGYVHFEVGSIGDEIKFFVSEHFITSHFPIAFFSHKYRCFGFRKMFDKNVDLIPSCDMPKKSA